MEDVLMSATRPPRCCTLCHQPGHRSDGCPTRPAAPRGLKVTWRLPPASARHIDSILAAAEALGEAQTEVAVEKAQAEIWGRVKALRLALIRSRAANAKLRAQVEDEKVSADLAKLDAKECARE
jgi:hypothetical protein